MASTFSFPPQSEAERIALCQFARTTPLVYGPWQHFKKLYKDAEAPAFSGGEVDTELLAILLARVDDAPMPQAASGAFARLEPMESVPALATDRWAQKNIKRATGGGATWTIAPRKGESYDSGGWMLIRQSDAQSTPVFRRTFENLRRALGAAETASEETKTPQNATQLAWEFNAGSYIGTLRDTNLKGAVLTVQSDHATYELDLSDPAFPHFANQSPRPATLRYMKRRARRLLRKLSFQRPELYANLAAQMFREKSGGDAATSWVAMDVLYANSARWAQPRGGLGPYEIVAPKFVRYTREERAPQIWDAHLDLVSELFVDENVAPRACEMAMKILRANSQELPELSLLQLERFLNSGLPLLQILATRGLAELLGRGVALSGETTAAAYLVAGFRARGAFADALRQTSHDAQWRQSFAARLGQTLDDKSARRKRTAALLLFDGFADTVPTDAVFRHLQFLLELNQSVSEKVLKTVAQSGSRGEIARLDDLTRLPESLRERALAAFCSRAQGAQPTAKQALELVSNSEAQSRVAWRYLAATGITRKALVELWKALISDYYHHNLSEGAAWNDPNALALFQRANLSPEEFRKSLPRYGNFEQVASYVAPYLSPDFLDALVGYFSLERHGIAGMLFVLLEQFRPEVCTHVLEKYLDEARSWNPSEVQILKAFGYWHTNYSGEPAYSDAPKWRFLAASAVKRGPLLQVWQRIFASPFDFSDALADEARTGLFRRAQIPAEEIAEWLRADPNRAWNSSAGFFQALLESVAGQEKVRLITGANSEQWARVQPIVVGLLEDAAWRNDFWRGVFDALREETELGARITDDPVFRRALAALSSATFADFLARGDIEHEPLLLLWLYANEESLERNDPALIAAATHALPSVRERGLNRARKLGLDLPLALRLMEAGLPQPFEVGREWFQNASPENHRDYALALCDSPQRAVRNYGRSFVGSHNLLDADLLARLGQNPDPQMQAWVGQKLLDSGAGAQPDFDAAVLRTRGRSRRAKESVKERLESSPNESANVAALLEAARSRTPRDREWALQQLARLAMAGEKIEGVAVKALTPGPSPNSGRGEN